MNQRRYIYITKWLYLLIHISPECVFLWKFFSQWFLPFIFIFVLVSVLVSILHARPFLQQFDVLYTTIQLIERENENKKKTRKIQRFIAFIWRTQATMNILFKNRTGSHSLWHHQRCISISVCSSVDMVFVSSFGSCQIFCLFIRSYFFLSFLCFVFIPISHKLNLNASLGSHSRQFV